MEAAELYIKGTAIGSMDYYIFPHKIGWDTATQERLDWNKVYQLCKADLLPLIHAIEPLTHTVKPFKYQRVAVYDANGNELNHLNCYYDNDHWVVISMGLDYVEHVVSVQVELKPPPLNI